MALTCLPTEIIDHLIIHVLPEGFESLALTCRRFYVQCAPYIERHNKLRSRFQNFAYYAKLGDRSPIRTASDLITLIAIEPIIARYIQNANFRDDSLGNLYVRGNPWPREMPADDKAVARLFAHSLYLEQAGLDWKEFNAEFKEHCPAEHSMRAHYSQRNALFLLTLLPNVKTLRLPALWNQECGPLNKTEKLIDAIIREARQSRLHYDRPSLAHVTEFSPATALGPQSRFELDWAMPFLALPHIRSFFGPSCVAVGDTHLRYTSKDLHCGFSETIEEANFAHCCIDDVGIADFLKETPRLRALRYSHSTKDVDAPHNWDICKFFTAIEREAGSHLVELSVFIHKLRGAILPGKTSMRGLKRVEKLEFPLEVAMCNVAASQVVAPKDSYVRSSTDHDLDDCRPFINILVPPSVTHLSLISRGTDHHDKALDLMFRDFAAKKDFQLAALKHIYLTCHPKDADITYKDQCAKLLAETKQAGVVLHLKTFPNSVSTEWDYDVLSSSS